MLSYHSYASFGVATDTVDLHISFSHLTAGNPSSLQKVIAIMWLKTRIAIFLRFEISFSQNCKFAIVWQALNAWKDFWFLLDYISQPSMRIC